MQHGEGREGTGGTQELTTAGSMHGAAQRFGSPCRSPARGGCIIALACDCRVLADNLKYHIGLNETLLGITTLLVG